MNTAISAEGWDDVQALAFPARCGHPPLDWEELRNLLPTDCSHVLIVGRACLSSLDSAPNDFPPTQVAAQEQCFHLVASEHLVAENIAQGGYLLTPAWLANWPERLEDMGFQVEQAKDFFQDFARELVFLNTDIDKDSPQHLEKLQEAVGLPVREVPVGVDGTRALLTRLVLNWRLDLEKQSLRKHAQQHNKELADQVLVMDMLPRLSQTQDENEAIELIKELFFMLFAPEALHYLRVENDVPMPDASLPADLLQTLQSLGSDYAWTADDKGFLLRIRHNQDTLGLVAVERLAYPQYRERYLNVALVLNGVCALAIENARNRHRLIEAEKMASLGMLVAGIAHEVNTPLGVSLTAASTMQQQSKNLAQSFAERRMTQNDLKMYLDNAGLISDLLLKNLQRISQLIDAFRQIAVEGQSVEKRLFGFREHIQEVLNSLVKRLPTDQITVELECDEDLEINSITSDWSNILINLISNSLQHGFKQQDQGLIRIQVSHNAKRLLLDYKDDGAGLSTETQARIFDPFYTTNLQLGMGLGMHLVYNIINHRLKGSIQCSSQLGQGTHFHIEVPL